MDNQKFVLRQFCCTPLILIVFCLHTSITFASEFRTFRPILTPIAMPQGAAVQANIKPVSRQLAEKAVGKLIDAWNSNQLDGVLATEFTDKSRLTDAMNSKVPRDARLEVLGIQSMQTLQQSVVDSPNGKLLVSTVSVTVKTQLTFNDPANGYQRREGINEYILRIKQKV